MAQTSSQGTIGLSLTVRNACVVNGATSVTSTLGSVGTIAFADQPGTFDTVDGELQGALGALQIQCSPLAQPLLTVGAGANDQSSQRHLVSNGNLIAYSLYTDAQRLSEIAIGEQIDLGVSNGDPISVPIYARARSDGQFRAAGLYTDTVQVTLSW
ncbi:MAG: spore coat U domain-containing protein [Erythrobacter sp.]|nr:spore coat U domain-containing protein [Erythrobacter sp.]